jgi:restriction system protein
MAKRQSMAEDVMDITAKLPWWVGVSLAAVSFIILHWYVGQEVPKAEGVNAITQAAVSGLYRTLAMLGQYVLPALFLIGALVSALKGFKRKKLYENTNTSSSTNVLDNMSWKEFELLIGEHFRRQGHKVVETAGGADGGVDLIVTKNGEKYLVQCKQWKAYKVGVKIVRELLGVMVGAGAAGGYVVTSGEFTRDAVAFASANNIELLDGKDLRRIMRTASRPSKNATVSNFGSPKSDSTPASNKKDRVCAKCGSPMKVRVAKQGSRAGQEFLGCSKFPACRYTEPLN